MLSPVLEIRPTAAEIPAGEFDALIATSAHAFATHAPAQLAGLPIFVVGESAAAAARAAGFASPEIAPDAAALAEVLCAKCAAGARLLYLAGRDRKPDLERLLASRAALQVVETYRADAAEELAPEARGALARSEIGAVLHYSRRSAGILLALVVRSGLAAAVSGLRHVAISADAAEPLLAAGWRVEIAAAPNENAMLSSLGVKDTKKGGDQ